LEAGDIMTTLSMKKPRKLLSLRGFQVGRT